MANEKLKITGIDVTDYMGIEHESFDVGPHGVEIKGKIESGKTSLKNAFLAGLKGGEYAKAEYIRNGAKKAVILIKMGDAAVKLVMRHSGNELTTDGFGLGEPRSRLKALFSPIDPLAFWMAKEPERQAMILAAMPCTVTAEEMGNWTSGEWDGSVDGHGLKVIAKARKHFFDKRTDANRTAKASEDTAARMKAQADALAATVPIAAMTVEDARVGVESTKAAITSLETRQRQAVDQEERAKGTRARIVEIRADAEGQDDKSQNGPTPEEVEEATASVTQAANDVEELKRKLALAEGVLQAAKERKTKIDQADEAAKSYCKAAVILRKQADDLEASLASVAIVAPTPEEIATATDAACQAGQVLKDAETVAKARAALAEYEAAKQIASLDIKAADYLDGIVNTLTNQAPAELAKRTEIIPGVAITDEGITVDGKLLKLLSGGKSMFFAVELAKRAKADGRLLTIDELGRLDPESRLEFVKLCVADDWQLIGTRAESGKLVVEQIEVE